MEKDVNIFTMIEKDEKLALRGDFHLPQPYMALSQETKNDNPFVKASRLNELISGNTLNDSSGLEQAVSSLGSNPKRAMRIIREQVMPLFNQFQYDTDLKDSYSFLSSLVSNPNKEYSPDMLKEASERLYDIIDKISTIAESEYKKAAVNALSRKNINLRLIGMYVGIAISSVLLGVYKFLRLKPQGSRLNPNIFI